MRSMIRATMRYKISMLVLMLFVIGNVIGSLALPAYLAVVVNDAIPQKDTMLVINLGGKMLLFVLIAFASNIAIGFFAAKISTGVARDLRSNVFRKVQYFSNAEFDKISTSSLITRTNNDIIQIQNFINMMLRVSLTAPFMSIGGVAMAFDKNANMSMILMISMPIMILLVVIIGKKSTTLSIIMQNNIDKINLITREKLTGIRVARAFGTEEFESERFFKTNKDFMNNSIKMNAVIGLLVPGLSIILYFTMVALLAFGGYYMVDSLGGILVGDIIAVIQYVMQVMMSILMLSMVFMMYPRASVSMKRINEIYHMKAMVEDSGSEITDTSLKGVISFDQVTFSYPGSNEPAIKNISFSSGPGEITALIGSTGSGKSTIVNLIPRFYEINSGQILIDGLDIRKYSLSSLRKKIGMVPQKSFLFQGSIADNVRFGKSNASNDEVVEAIRIAQSQDFVTSKEKGYESPISQGGANVSGGQRQRLSISRAIVRKPEIYIFDDSFSALDFKTDAALRKELVKEAANSTIILVAQRVSTIMNADRILVIDRGECVGIGRHEELLATCAIYQEIVYSQLSKEEA